MLGGAAMWISYPRPAEKGLLDIHAFTLLWSRAVIINTPPITSGAGNEARHALRGKGDPDDFFS